MKRSLIAAFAAATIVAALLAAGSVAYRALAAGEAGKQAARADFEHLLAHLAPVRLAKDLADPKLRAALMLHYKESSALLLVAVYERGSGIRWRLPADSPYLPASADSLPVPEPSYPPRSALLLSAPLAGDPTGRLAVDALYTTIPQGLLFVAFRDALLALCAYAALAALAVALLAFARSGRRGEESLSPAAIRAARDLEGAFDEVDDGFLRPEEEFSIPDMEGESPALGDSIVTLHRDAPATAAAEGGASLRAAGPTGLYSPVSGLGWESYFAERLDSELARSASFEQDLALLFLVYDGLGPESPQYALVAKALKEFFSFRDLAFERGRGGFAVILPSIDADHALRMAEEFLKKLTFLLRDRSTPLQVLPLYIGLSSRSGRLVDAARISQEASSAVDKAREDRDSRIVAFRPDPDKYRLFLASKGC